ncbi:DNA-binding PadR family transcriptional regulator [Paenibacillus shirakamiensis]|uniref:DNA-binding PadR family transcriptional regulator n=1 Tax=Paenibacillus shirakamiensis TaxID=1265935 RepID=A0ABS4JIT6_9BACL|nr:PadR family transcriptional regulator [Paenibacillus shirakamiensis]MBP2000519.1 DNA-binding PadR family transcriptional regulator [Paenibacillus shirakamiensis]
MSMKLAILGILLEKDMHPYEMRLKMKEKAVDRNAKIQIGSLYYAVDQLALQGYLEVVEVIKSDKRPDKTVYHITDTGIAYFEELLMQQFEMMEPVYHPMYIALAFAKYGDQKKIAAVLKERVRKTEHQVNFYYEIYQDHVGTVSRSVLYLMAGRYEHELTELKWLRKLYEDAEAGLLAEMGERIDLIDD